MDHQTEVCNRFIYVAPMDHQTEVCNSQRFIYVAPMDHQTEVCNSQRFIYVAPMDHQTEVCNSQRFIYVAPMDHQTEVCNSLRFIYVAPMDHQTEVCNSQRFIYVAPMDHQTEVCNSQRFIYVAPMDHQTEDSSNEDILDNLYTQDYEPQVLAALSATTMMHFFPYPRKDMEYPSINLQEAFYCSNTDSSSRFLKQKQGKQLRNQSVTPANVTRLMSIRWPQGGGRITMNAAHSQFSFSNLDFPVSEEVIKSITTFCFPDNMKIYATKPESFAHFLVLTDMSGNKSYATCLTFCRSFIVEKDERGHIYMTLDTTMEALTAGQYRTFVPHCGIFISKFPYFSTTKDILSYMTSLISQKPDDMLAFIKEISHTVTLTPVPPVGPVAVEICLHDKQPFTIYPPVKADKSVIDIPLHLVFISFHEDQILQVLAALFMEERIVFLSSSYALLTTISESFLNFLLPFRWRFTYVPILSLKALDLLDAPGTFIMGCHLKHRSIVEQIEGLVVVNIDEGTVMVNSTSNTSDNHHIPAIPEEPATSFRKVCKRARVFFELEDVQRPTCHNVSEEKKIRETRIRRLNRVIEEGCLELMVNLFRGVVLEVRPEHHSFNEQLFLESQGKSPEDKLFYKKVLKKDMFKSFLDDRLKEKTDYWTEFERKTRQFVKQASLGDIRVSQVHPRKPLNKQVSLSRIHENPYERPLVIVRLPQNNSSSQYLSSCITSLSISLQSCMDYQERISYLYLMAVFKFADHDHVGALTDIITLAAIDWNLLPTLLVHEIHNLLTAQEKLNLEKVKGYHNIIEKQKEESQSMDTSTIRRYHNHNDIINIPDYDLAFDVFRKYVSLYEMTQDYDTISRLFQALTGMARETHLDHETFQAFCLCWQENHEQCMKVMEERDLQTDESVLKVSSLCKTDFGTGRVVLTDKRLLLMRDASKKLKEIVKLRDIQFLEKVQLHSLFSVADALRIHRLVPGKAEHDKFTVWLKDERNHFTLLVQEMWAGKVISEATKDIVVVQQAAQNVLLIDTIIRSGEEEDCSHHATVESSAEYLCCYIRAMGRGEHLLSVTTKEALQNKLDPNFSEPERTSIQALLYTPGDTETHLSPNFPFSNVAVIVPSLSCIHFSYSASVNGVIIRWYVKGLTVANRIALDMSGGETLRRLQYAQGYLWCGVWKGIWQISKKGELLAKFSFDIPKSDVTVHPVEMECFYIMDNDQIWAGCRRDGNMVVMNTKTGRKDVEVIKLESRGISIMVKLKNRMWVGTKSGIIYVVDIETRKIIKTLKAHSDAVRALCCADDRYIISGAGSSDGKIAIWTPTDTRSASGRFLLE
ncbi:DENN domain-containing protein 3-like [Ylistrum balloti]|uniref:DENN domain-containing protein 3-like n=1 Tax=Ylistrum balloti TaxID=509963 RepID=UPI002905CE89|nr:DENN domain-containing protein 3-like [Ylistrum balloti]